jgi:hypothetical protein
VSPEDAEAIQTLALRLKQMLRALRRRAAEAEVLPSGERYGGKLQPADFSLQSCVQVPLQQTAPLPQPLQQSLSRPH